MSGGDEWGPWIEHDGGPRPVAAGVIVAIQIRGHWTAPNGNPDCDIAGVWAWHWDGGVDDIIRYRIRKPKGLTILESLLENLPEQVDA